MCSKCWNVFLSAVIIVFTLWWIAASKWIILVSAIIMFIYHIVMLSKHGCHGFCMKEKTGSELFMEKTDKELHEGPSKEELKETMKNKPKKMPKKK
jgi:hypothetical protein